MVRKGSPVRVRQRALAKAPLRRGFSLPGASGDDAGMFRGPLLGRILFVSEIAEGVMLVGGLPRVGPFGSQLRDATVRRLGLVEFLASSRRRSISARPRADLG